MLELSHTLLVREKLTHPLGRRFHHEPQAQHTVGAVRKLGSRMLAGHRPQGQAGAGARADQWGAILSVPPPSPGSPIHLQPPSSPLTSLLSSCPFLSFTSFLNKAPLMPLIHQVLLSPSANQTDLLGATSKIFPNSFLHVTVYLWLREQGFRCSGPSERTVLVYLP